MVIMIYIFCLFIFFHVHFCAFCWTYKISFNMNYWWKFIFWQNNQIFSAYILAKYTDLGNGCGWLVRNPIEELYFLSGSWIDRCTRVARLMHPLHIFFFLKICWIWILLKIKFDTCNFQYQIHQIWAKYE